MEAALKQGDRNKPATIIAVANRAGVSPSTVSRVMNGNATVDAAIAARVRSAALELNYSASPLARSLVLGRTMTVSILVPDLSNPTFQGVLRGASHAASRNGYRVLIADSEEHASEEGSLVREMRKRSDAVILCAPRMPETDLAALVGEVTPIVLINRDSPGLDVPLLAADYETGVKLLARHLYVLGHRRIVYLEGTTQSASNSLRRRGLATFCDEHPDVRLDVVPCGSTFEDGYAVSDDALATGATGILAFNDLVAMGLMSSLAELGVRVPHDVSVTGFDDITFARYLTPSLTTASVPVEELGREAWVRLHALLSGEPPPGNVQFRPRLEVRGSTAPPRGIVNAGTERQWRAVPAGPAS